MTLCFDDMVCSADKQRYEIKTFHPQESHNE